MFGRRGNSSRHPPWSVEVRVSISIAEGCVQGLSYGGPAWGWVQSALCFFPAPCPPSPHRASQKS